MVWPVLQLVGQAVEVLLTAAVLTPEAAKWAHQVKWFVLFHICSTHDLVQSYRVQWIPPAQHELAAMRKTWQRPGVCRCPHSVNMSV